MPIANPLARGRLADLTLSALLATDPPPAGLAAILGFQHDNTALLGVSVDANGHLTVSPSPNWLSPPNALFRLIDTTTITGTGSVNTGNVNVNYIGPAYFIIRLNQTLGTAPGGIEFDISSQSPGIAGTQLARWSMNESNTFALPIILPSPIIRTIATGENSANTWTVTLSLLTRRP